MSRLMVSVFAVVCAVYGGVVGWASQVLPADAPIPVHWPLGGGPADGWSTRSGAVWLLGLLGGAVAGLFVLLLGLLDRNRSLLGVNIPNKPYWTRPENLPTARRLLRTDLALLGTGAMLLLTDMAAATVVASRTPRGVSPMWSDAIVGLCLAAALGWTVWMTARRYRIPTDGTRTDGTPG